MTITYRVKKEIDEKTLRDIWQQKFSDKPFPKVKALIQSNKDYNKAVKKAKEMTKERTEANEVEEWGRVLKTKETEAYATLDMKTGTSFILIQECSRTPLKKLLEHELEHIYKGEVN